MNTLLYVKTGADLVAITATGKKVVLSKGHNDYSDSFSSDLDTLDNVTDYNTTPPEWYPVITITFTIPNGDSVTQTFSPNQINGDWEKEDYFPAGSCSI